MDPDKIKKRQSLKLIISESVMVITVIITVVVLALVVSGYWLNSDFKVERQGMLQVSSVPAGASVEIDSESSWMQRTNTSKVLSSGEHTVTLSKEGYDSWSKTINISEGLLYRLNYPRLFLKEREARNLLSIDDAVFATVSSDHGLLLITNNTTNWKLLNLKDETIKPQIINVSNLFSAVSVAANANVGVFTGEIIKADWDYDDSHILFKVKKDNDIEWVILDVKNPEKSINITREFGGNYTEIEILDNSANNLLAIHNGNLHKIDIAGRSVSAVIVNNIISFDHFNKEIVFIARRSNEEMQSNQNASEYYAGYTKLDDAKISEVSDAIGSSMISISGFYDDKYITVSSDTHTAIYNTKDFTLYKEYNHSFVPSSIKVGHQGEFILLNSGSQIASIDMEANSIKEWAIDCDNYGWIDNNMLYTVSDNNLIVYDFDGLNRRTLANNVSSKLPVAITNNKWLYYFRDNDLVREVISE